MQPHPAPPAEDATAGNAVDTWHRLVREQVRAILHYNGFDRYEINPLRGGLEGAFYVASVGFVGDEVSGAVVVAAEHAMATAGQDHQGIPRERQNSEDFVGEVCNMFAGRLKSALLARGMRTMIATPSVMRVQNLLLSGAVNRFSLCEKASSAQGSAAYSVELAPHEQFADQILAPVATSEVSEGVGLFL